jgi:hypothetical protein
MNQIPTLDHFLRNFIARYADEKIRQPGAWMPYQHRAALHAIDSIVNKKNKLITWLWSRQTGKTESVGVVGSCSWLIIAICGASEVPLIQDVPYGATMRRMFPDGLRVGIFAPKGDSGEKDFERCARITKRISIRFRDPAGHPIFSIPTKNTEKRIVTYKGPDGEDHQAFYLRLQSAAPTSQVEGETLDLIVDEECQDLERYKLEAEINPMRAATKGTRLDVGTVGFQDCHFDHVIDANKLSRPEDHFEVHWEEAVACGYQNGDYQDFITKEMERLGGPDSPEFQAKFCLVRNYAVGMLVTDSRFVQMAAPREERWYIPDELPPPEVMLEKGLRFQVGEPENLTPQVFLCASLDVAKDNDYSVFKLGTADWRHVKIDELGNLWPEIIVRWQRTYDHVDYGQQFQEMLEHLKYFPSVRRFCTIVIDATGGRGDMVGKFDAAGFTTFGVQFTGGKKLTESDPRTGEVKAGSRSSFCREYVDSISAYRFRYAADEFWMGTFDFYMALGRPIPPGYRVIPATREYTRHKYEATHCFRETSALGILDLHAKSGDPSEHDDQVTADFMLVHGGHWHQPVDMSLATGTGQFRPTADFSPSIRADLYDSINRLMP